MHGSAFEPIKIPTEVWDREDSREILKNRDVAGLFKLAAKYAGASQVDIGAATGLSQGRVSRISRHQSHITELDVYERIATGLGLPDHARMVFGLAPLDTASPTGNYGDHHQEQSEELTARIEAAAAIDPTIVMILTTDTNNLRLMDRRLGGIAIADKMRAQISMLNTPTATPYAPASAPNSPTSWPRLPHWPAGRPSTPERSTTPGTTTSTPKLPPAKPTTPPSSPTSPANRHTS